jgi:hypothetical protein
MLIDAEHEGYELALVYAKSSAPAAVRHEGTLAALPADERAAWKKLWADVAELARKAEGKK